MPGVRVDEVDFFDAERWEEAMTGVRAMANFEAGFEVDLSRDAERDVTLRAGMDSPVVAAVGCVKLNSIVLTTPAVDGWMRNPRGGDRRAFAGQTFVQIKVLMTQDRSRRC